MVKTTVYLEAAELEILERLAREQRESSAELIRRAIRLLNERERPQPRLSYLGCVSSGGLELSSKVDKMLGQWAKKANARRLRRRR